jgi:serine/threonine-protein kinase
MASDERKIHDEVVLAGKYRLGPSIGCGGMGTVHRATHVLLHRPVAVKLLHPSDDPQLAERFLREAQVAAAARHPNVVDIIDFGTTDDGQPFMVMELLEGQSLRELYESGIELTLDEQLDVMVQVLKGLEAVHRTGIVHRDLKPANVFLTEQEDGTLRARLLDFGISFTVDRDREVGDEDMSQRVLAGTPEYMSFEQCEGRHDIDERADVHAIGVMLYELFSGGALPFEGCNPGAVLFQVMSCRHTPLIELRPDLPELAALVERCLSPDRDDRPQSARDLRKALLLAAGRSDGPTSQRSIPPALHDPSDLEESVVIYVDDDAPRPRRRWGWGVGASVVVAAAVLLAASFVTHVEQLEDVLLANGLTIPSAIGALVAAPGELPVSRSSTEPALRALAPMLIPSSPDLTIAESEMPSIVARAPEAAVHAEAEETETAAETTDGDAVRARRHRLGEARAETRTELPSERGDASDPSTEPTSEVAAPSLEPTPAAFVRELDF